MDTDHSRSHRLPKALYAGLGVLALIGSIGVVATGFEKLSIDTLGSVIGVWVVLYAAAVLIVSGCFALWVDFALPGLRRYKSSPLRFLSDLSMLMFSVGGTLSIGVISYWLLRVGFRFANAMGLDKSLPTWVYVVLKAGAVSLVVFATTSLLLVVCILVKKILDKRKHL